MFHSTIRNRLNIIAVIFLTTGMFSQAEAQDPLSLACPNGYAFLEPICLNEMSGDVVNSHPTMLLSGAARTTPIIIGQRAPSAKCNGNSANLRDA